MVILTKRGVVRNLTKPIKKRDGSVKIGETGCVEDGRELLVAAIPPNALLRTSESVTGTEKAGSAGGDPDASGGIGPKTAREPFAAKESRPGERTTQRKARAPGTNTPREKRVTKNTKRTTRKKSGSETKNGTCGGKEKRRKNTN